MEQFVSFLGLFAMIGLAWLMSAHRRRVRWRLVATGVLLQFVFAALIFHTATGRFVFTAAKDVFVAVINCTNHGSKFMFDEPETKPQTAEKSKSTNRARATKAGQARTGGEAMPTVTLLRRFAFVALPTIIFFSSLMSILYYFGVMQWTIRWMAIGMQKTLGTSGAETLSAAANVFVGQTEAPLVIRPYVPDMTRSELMALMVGGFATVAGSVLAIYVGLFKVDAEHLLIASVISAPAALVVAKVLQPEVDHSKTLGKVEIDAPSEATNTIHAAAMGAADGAKLAINVGAMLIAFIALVALADLLMASLGNAVAHAFNYVFGYHLTANWSLTGLLGYLFAPFAWLLGVQSDECLKVGQLLGIKMVGTEFLAYKKLYEFQASTPLSPRSEMIATYALCGFANFASIGIQIGGIGPLAPERRGELAQLGFRAMLGGTIAACMTACVAGVLRYQ